MSNNSNNNNNKKAKPQPLSSVSHKIRRLDLTPVVVVAVVRFFLFSSKLCGTAVVPSQVDLFFIRCMSCMLRRHTEVGYVRNRTLEGQRRGNTSLDVHSRSQNGLAGL